MRTDADDLARVRDPAIERLLNHSATLTSTLRSIWCREITRDVAAAFDGHHGDVFSDGLERSPHLVRIDHSCGAQT